jgi:hypothetical protein
MPISDPMLRRASVRCGVLAAVLSVTAGPASAQAQAPLNVPAQMVQDEEIALALSACPPFVAQKAGVYVLRSSGYAKVRESSNGFNALVQHSLPQAQDPQCIDAEGSRTILPRYLKVAELRAQGKTPEEIRRFVADAYAKGTFKPPARVGIDYMLSTHNLTPNSRGEVVPFPPHVMIYAPFLTNADLGLGAELGPDGNPVGPAFVAGEGQPQALIIVLVGGARSHVHPAQVP